MKVFIVFILVIGIYNCVVFGKSLSSQNEDLVSVPAGDIAVLPTTVATETVEKIDEYETEMPLEDTAFDIADEDSTIGTTASSIIADVNENAATKPMEAVTMASVEASTEENAINRTGNAMDTYNEFPEHLVKDLEEAENRNKLERNEEQHVVLVPVLVQRFWIFFSGSNPFGNETNENGTNENGTDENGTNEDGTDEDGTEDRDGVGDDVIKIIGITIPDVNSDMEMTNTSEYPQETIEKAGDDYLSSPKNVEEEQTMDPSETIDEKADTESPPEELPLMLA